MSHRHDVWGDDPEEREADEIVADVLAAEPELARRWHDHPAVVPFKAVVLFLGHNAKRLVITIAGVVLLVLGLAGIVLPFLPGWLLIFAGLAVLSTEYVWAERLLKRAKRAATAAKDRAMARKKARS
ncbi:MAG: PGPGW domain-containing protein [Actinomycetota bacterium]|nr:PGPGW domain-containing protein [Actinomycetota bacterium]